MKPRTAIEIQIGRHGRITLPEEVMEHLQVHPGDNVFFVSIGSDTILITKWAEE